MIAPESVHFFPRPVHFVPEPFHFIPEPFYSVPELIHFIPELFHFVPEPVHIVPEPVHIVPEPLHSVPELLHSVPEPVYSVPEPVHGILEKAIWHHCGESNSYCHILSIHGAIQQLLSGFEPLPQRWTELGWFFFRSYSGSCSRTSNNEILGNHYSFSRPLRFLYYTRVHDYVAFPDSRPIREEHSGREYTIHTLIAPPPVNT